MSHSAKRARPFLQTGPATLTQLEVEQAEIERGRTEVALLEAGHLVRTQRLRLMEVLGVQVDREPELTSEFEIFEPRWEVDSLVALEAAVGRPLRGEKRR